MDLYNWFSDDKNQGIFPRLAGGQISSRWAGLEELKKGQRGLRGSVSREHCGRDIIYLRSLEIPVHN